MANVKKTIDTKILQILVSDFIKLYSIDVVTESAQDDKRKAEKKLVDEIKNLMSLYEY
ncbi:MAG: hypothetical protein NC037_02045 [Bacteroides sp.]|nr:hypothetical protein [Bacillota bacterium]MCM1393469.1 hypothetical protein [[Eubacterium] siraeum]MCM1455297.1 hypothetical protein [Bacteroides sp.]